MRTKYMIRFISVAQAHVGLVDNVSRDCLHQTPNVIESPATYVIESPVHICFAQFYQIRWIFICYLYRFMRNMSTLSDSDVNHLKLNLSFCIIFSSSAALFGTNIIHCNFNPHQFKNVKRLFTRK